MPRSRRRPPLLGPNLPDHIREARACRHVATWRSWMSTSSSRSTAIANEWFVRKARRVLAERSTRGEPLDEAKAALRTLFDHDPEPSRKIRALCSLFVIGGDRCPVPARAAPARTRIRPDLGDPAADRRTADRHDLQPSGRAGRRLPADLRSEFAALARDDPSALVRLVLASTLQRLPVGQREELARSPRLAIRGQRRPQSPGHDLDRPDPGRRVRPGCARPPGDGLPAARTCYG